jgi:hypothetical protein
MTDSADTPKNQGNDQSREDRTTEDATTDGPPADDHAPGGPAVGGHLFSDATTGASSAQGAGEPEDASGADKSQYGLVMGIAFGIPFGGLFGLLLFDNFALGMVFGISIGLAIGVAYDAWAAHTRSATESRDSDVES